MSETIRVQDLQPGDVLLYHGTGFISQAIQFFDGTEMCHAALYMGKHEVGEAVAQGLVREDISLGMQGEGTWVLANRLKEVPVDMQPVLDKGQWYIDQGNRYAFEQLLLLAFLCTTRKLKVTPIVRRLIRSVLDAATSILTRLADAGRQPMICSEFVYRAYDEALPELDDVYSLRINEFVPADAMGAPAGAAGARAIPALRGQGIHPQSLLALLASNSSEVWIRSTAAPRRRAMREVAPPGVPAVEELVQQYLQEVKAEPATIRALGRARAADVTVEELRAAVDAFAVSLYKTSQPEPVAERAVERMAVLGSRSPAYKYLFRTVADFVTPGDLLKTQSLYRLGRLVSE
jgi:hypothetical protein